MILPFFLSFITGLVASACLPDAGFTNLTWDLTPWSFPVFALAIGILHQNVRNAPTRLKAALHGFLWAFGYFIMGLNWVGNALLVDGNPYAWAYPFALMGLPFLLSFFLAISFALTYRAIRTLSLPSSSLMFIGAFAAAEWARGHFFTGFPWNPPGMFWSSTLPVFQNLSIVGIHGLTLLSLFWGMAFFLIFEGRREKSKIIFMALALVSFASCLSFGLWRLSLPKNPSSEFQAVLVQANIPQSQKWDTDKFADHFAAHIALSMPQENLENLPTVIVWPETALPPEFIESPAIRDQIKELLSVYPKNSYLLTGGLRVGQKGNDWAYYNSLIAYDQKGNIVTASDKFHLVPFGEYMPFQKWVPIGPIARFTGLQPGNGPRTVTLPDLPPFSPLICYEVIFSGKVTDKKNPPSFIVNLTNDSWYGNSAGPRQHLAQARARAIEENIPVIRVAETGISAIFDQHGHVTETIPYNEMSQKIAKVEVNLVHTTNAYMYWQDMPFFITLMLIFILLYLRQTFYP